MSSIYDALRRTQVDKQAICQPEATVSAPARRMFRVILAAVIISSVCTAALLYAIGIIGGRHGVQEVKTPETQKDPERIWSLMVKADRLHKKGDLTGAIDTYSEVLVLSPAQAEVYMRLGSVYYEAQQYDKALATYTRVLKRAQNDARLLNNIGSVLLAKGDAAKALGYFIQARRNSADYVEPLYNMACAYARMKKKDAALSSLRQACGIQPEARLWARRDPDLQSLKGDKDFETIVRAQ